MLAHQESPLPRLLEEINQLNTKLHELSVQNYRQVVDARESLSRCNEISQNLQTKVTETTDTALPKLRQKLTRFQDMGRQLCSQHKKTSLMIDLNANLVDLLSIPQLMDTCARSGAVEEALELCSFSRTLRTRHEAIVELKQGTRGADIIRRIAEEVETSAIQLRKQLLGQLRGPIDLPTCLRLLSHLKRLDVTINNNNNGNSLQQEFLDARDAYLHNQSLQIVDHNDLPYQTCLKQIQKNREVWFDVITQFQAVFGNKPLLGRWIRAKVMQFLTVLDTQFASRFENCGEIGTVYELCSSFASSLARVGADFRPLMQQVFMFRAREICKQSWTVASNNAQQSFAAGDFGMSTTIAAAAGEDVAVDDLAPSPLFLQFPALVDLCNALLRSFNDLRSFACLNLVNDLAQELVKALELAVQGLEQFSANSGGAQEQQKKRFQLLLDLVANRFLGYIARCFAVVFEWKKPVYTLVDITMLVNRVKRMITAPPTVVVPIQQQTAIEVPVPLVNKEEEQPEAMDKKEEQQPEEMNKEEEQREMLNKEEQQPETLSIEEQQPEITPPSV